MGIFLEDLFEDFFSEFLEDFSVKKFLEDFFGRILGGGLFWEGLIWENLFGRILGGFFLRNSLFT